jgi:hypothetical protein
MAKEFAAGADIRRQSCVSCQRVEDNTFHLRPLSTGWIAPPRRAVGKLSIMSWAAGQRALRNRIVTIAGRAEEQRSGIKKRKKIKVLTRFRHFGYKRRFIPKFQLHHHS